MSKSTNEVSVERPAPMCMVLLENGGELNVDSIRAHLGDVLGPKSFSLVSSSTGGDSEIGTDTKIAPGSCIILWRNISFVVMQVNAPIPSQTFEMQTQYGANREVIRPLVARHKAHLIVRCSGAATHKGEAFINALSLLQLSTLLAEVSSPIAAYWSSSEVLTSWEEFVGHYNQTFEVLRLQAEGKDGAAKLLPKTLWVGLRVSPAPEGDGFGGYTLGLNAFTGFEVELAPQDMSSGAVAGFLTDIIDYLFASDAELRHGETLNIQGNENQYQVTRVAGPGQVPLMRLQLVQ